jgi:hypothetical protein
VSAVRERTGTLASSRLRRLAEAPAGRREPEPERCELCGEPIPPAHRHVLDTRDRELRCTCRACSLLFATGAAAQGHLRLVPERRLTLPALALDDLAWEELRLPVDMAFFFREGASGRVRAFYPSPMGPTESLLALEAWQAVEAGAPVLRSMADDVEALLVDRIRGARRQWLVPIDDCYALVGLIRTRWRGLTGGREVWTAIEDFFTELDRRAKPVPAGQADAATSAAGGS